MDSNWSVTDIVPEVGPDIQRRAFIPDALTYEMEIVETAVLVLLITEVFCIFRQEYLVLFFYYFVGYK